MPKVRLHRQSDLEKKLKILESQLYGKKLNQTSNSQSRAANIAFGDTQQNLSSEIPHSTSTSDLIFLRKDLTKIALLSCLAIGIQLVLYLSHALERVKIF